MGEFVMGASDFDVVISQGDDGPVVAVQGEIDLVTAPRLWDAVVGYLDSDAVLTFDMGGVTFLDSAGLALLLRANQRLAPRGGRLRVRNPTRPAELAMEVAGVLALFGGDEAQSSPSPS
jgi:anti-sigma B factor antagonist